MALPLGELSPKATEREKAVCRLLNDKTNLFLPSPTSLRSATSPKGRGKGCPRSDRQCDAAKMPQKSGGTPPPNEIRQNGTSVLPFVYFRQTQCKEIVEVILLSNQKDKMQVKDKKTQQKRPKVQ